MLIIKAMKQLLCIAFLLNAIGYASDVNKSKKKTKNSTIKLLPIILQALNDKSAPEALRWVNEDCSFEINYLNFLAHYHNITQSTTTLNSLQNRFTKSKSGLVALQVPPSDNYNKVYRHITWKETDCPTTYTSSNLLAINTDNYTNTNNDPMIDLSQFISPGATDWYFGEITDTQALNLFKGLENNQNYYLIRLPLATTEYTQANAVFEFLCRKKEDTSVYKELIYKNKSGHLYLEKNDQITHLTIWHIIDKLVNDNLENRPLA
jgi:hypothetical protein